MKISVRSKDANIKVWLPNSLIFSAPIRYLIVRTAAKSVGDFALLDPQMMNGLLQQIKLLSKEYKGLPFVEVQSADGEEVLIEL